MFSANDIRALLEEVFVAEEAAATAKELAEEDAIAAQQAKEKASDSMDVLMGKKTQLAAAATKVKAAIDKLVSDGSPAAPPSGSKAAPQGASSGARQHPRHRQ